MNRLIICTILLLTSHAVLAEKLYRWIESDGSITFSPTPPPAGVEFQSVNAAHGNTAPAKLPASGEQQPSILATSEHDVAVQQPRVNDTPILARPAAAIAKQGLSYAPETNPSVETTTTTVAALPPPQPALQRQRVASQTKRRQCLDLSKRVLSLERRLRSPLTPDDMDNTVIAMARYQRNYDRHCIE